MAQSDRRWYPYAIDAPLIQIFYVYFLEALDVVSLIINIASETRCIILHFLRCGLARHQTQDVRHRKVGLNNLNFNRVVGFNTRCRFAKVIKPAPYHFISSERCYNAQTRHSLYDCYLTHKELVTN